MTYKILVDGPAWLGDIIMAQVLFRRLKQDYPNAKLDVMVPQSLVAVVEAMSEVDTVLGHPFEHNQLALYERVQWARRLSAHQYDWAILTRNSLKSALIPFFARIPRRTGWLGEWRYGVVNDIRARDHTRTPLMVEQLLALALPPTASIPAEYALPALHVPEAQAHQVLQQLQLSLRRPVIALAPGAAYGPAKQWPADRFAELAKILVAKGYQVVLLGAAQDVPIAHAIMQAVGDDPVYNLVGKTKLQQVIALLSMVEVAVCNDSGLMHMAAALGRRVVVIYGATSALHTPPLAPNVRTLQRGLSCQPCFSRTCPLDHYRCLREISAGMVWSAVDAVQKA